MGNFCCPPSNPCSHTVEETKELLSSSDSKPSTKADWLEGVTPTEDSSQKDEEPTGLNNEVVNDQPVHKAVEAQSSYRSVMNILHTDTSRDTQACQSSSPEVSKETVDADREKTETKNNVGTETHTTVLEMVKAPLGTDITEKMEEKDQIVKTDMPVTLDKELPNEPDAKPLQLAEVNIQKENAELEENTPEVNIEENPAQLETESKAAGGAVEDKAAGGAVEDKAAGGAVEDKAAGGAVEDKAAGGAVEDKAAGGAVEDKAAGGAVEDKAAEVDRKQELAEVEMTATGVNVEKKPAKVDTEKTPAEVDIEKKPELDTEQELAEVAAMKAIEVDVQKKPVETSVDALIEKDTPQIQQIVQNISTTAKHEAEDLLISCDVALNSKKTDTSVTENGRVEPQISSAEASNELNVEEKDMSAKVITEEPVGQPVDKVEDKQDADIASNVSEMKEDGICSAAQEHSEQLSSPAVELSNKDTPHNIENGQVDDLKDEILLGVEAALEPEKPQETELAQKTCEEPSHIHSEAKVSETSANINSTQDEMAKSTNTASDQEKTTESVDKEQRAVEHLLNGLDSSSPVVKSESTETYGDSVQVETIEPTAASKAVLLEEHIQKEKELLPCQTENVEMVKDIQETTEKEDLESGKVHTGEIILSSSHAVKVALIPVSESISRKEEQEEDEDLYRGVEEIEKDLPKEKQSKPLLEFTIPGVEERCSLAATVDILAYSESEWKGNTAKSTLIRKGYAEMSCSFSGLRRVRGDNYCALRATLYQVLATTTQTPSWLLEEDFTLLPEKLEAQEHLIGGWMFPTECRKAGEKEEAVEKLKHYLELLQQKWRASVDSDSPETKQRVCDCVFQGGEEEYGLLEVLKFLMLARAVALHGKMQAGEEVPVFCWLLFARDTSENPRTLLSNHLSQIGFSGGLEQVEMFLLGYALQHTIQTFRLYKSDTEEFVTHYPDDHKQDWPCVCIVTEDDRHYNVPVRKRAQHQLNHDLSVLWPNLN